MNALFEYETAILEDALQTAPVEGGILALFGASGDKPYLSKTTNIKRRAHRLLNRDNGALRARIAKIAWRVTGSDFESNLILYRAYREYFDADEARKRMKLRTPYFIRYAAENRFPRLYVTNRLSRRALNNTFGPFASRAAAERYVEGVQELFPIRRCFEDLHPSPDDPGCIYGEMKKCIRPCQQAVTEQEYSDEALRVHAFLRSQGESLLTQIAAEREAASEAMEFEAAAAAHERYQSVKQTAALASDLVHAVPDLRGAIFLPSANSVPEVETWLLHQGCLRGPQRFSTLGIRIAREQSQVGSSLFAQPLMLEAVPLEPASAHDSSATPLQSPEERLLSLLSALDEGSLPSDLALLSDHLALLKRWYYRPEAKRVGTLCFPAPDGSWPARKLIRAAAKVALRQSPEAAYPEPPVLRGHATLAATSATQPENVAENAASDPATDSASATSADTLNPS